MSFHPCNDVNTGGAGVERNCLMLLIDFDCYMSSSSLVASVAAAAAAAAEAVLAVADLMMAVVTLKVLSLVM